MTILTLTKRANRYGRTYPNHRKASFIKTYPNIFCFHADGETLFEPAGRTAAVLGADDTITTRYPAPQTY